MRENLYFESCGARMSDKLSELSQHRFQEKNTQANRSFLEGKRHQSLEKPGKIYFYMIQSKMNGTKQRPRCRHDAHQYMCDL